MRIIIMLLFFISLTFKSLGQDSSFTIKSNIPIKIINTNSNSGSDTVLSMGKLSVNRESKKDMQLKLADTTYLNKIVGTYLIGNSGPEIIIKRNLGTLSIQLPGHKESNLVPMTSWLFTLKDYPDTKMFLYFDPKNNIPAINIQNATENYGANRKNYHFD
ncbi:MAG: hypothetical protein EOO93_20865 [Pedobacter sp.]|nr:MAG: hypothetical protein EOO93_20865 [Pedobacter sp.]